VFTIAILEIVKEDIEKEMKECFADNNANQGESEKSNGALQKTQFQWRLLPLWFDPQLLQDALGKISYKPIIQL
jgi:hypothetical protein